MTPALCLLVSYLLGSVPFGLVVGLLHGKDLRQAGSKNIGATNAGRVLGRPYAVLVFLLDFGKGWLPVFAAARILDPAGTWPLWCGVAAVLGHMFPLYLRFRGGKGVATAGGAFFGLAPLATGVALLVWVVTLLGFRMVALASLLAAWALPIACWWTIREDPSAPRSVLILAIVLAVLITIRHHSNLRRMLRGEEPRIGTPR